MRTPAHCFGGNGTGYQRLAIAIVLALGFGACETIPGDRRPSILLFVLDTTRADAVSAYGQVSGTTPELDGLASQGLRYTRAYAQAPWTLPSHATLFTGLLPSQHGVGWHRTRAPDSLVTLAERLLEAGYETVGVAENPWLSEELNLTQGFEHFTQVNVWRLDRPGVIATIAAWLPKRDRDRPFFLFVNVVDPHTPYAGHPESYFLPHGVNRIRARMLSQEPGDYFCLAEREHDLEILWGLYLGDVMKADKKLRRLRSLLENAGLERDLITIVTSDHGEHFGENRFVGHQFSVREPLIHVPLVIHGVPGTEPAVIDQPVQLADIVPTVLEWAGVRAPGNLPGVPLPTAPGEAQPRDIIAEHDDLTLGPVPNEGKFLRSYFLGTAKKMRRNCTPDVRVFGDMRTLIRYPSKVVWYSNYPPEFYDLEDDPLEERDLARKHPLLTADLVAKLDRLVGNRTPVDEVEPDVELPRPDVIEQLRALGYVETGEGEPAPRTGAP